MLAAAARTSRPPTFWALAMLFGAFALFLYGPIAAVVILAFQGPEGGLVFPMKRPVATLVRRVVPAAIDR